MRWPSLVVLCAGLSMSGVAPPALADENDQAFRDVTLGNKFELDRGQLEAAAPGELVEIGEGYAVVSYEIGDKQNRPYWEKAVRAMLDTLPQKFGNSVGTYTVALDIRTPAGKELVKRPLLNFTWTKQRDFLIIDKIVSEIEKVKWNGTLVDNLLVTDETKALEVGLHVYQARERSLDFGAMQATSKLFTAGALAGTLPLSVATVGVFNAITPLIKTFYDRNSKKDLVSSAEYDIPVSDVLAKSKVVFRDSQNRKWTLPVMITLSSRPSLYLRGAFDASKVSASWIDRTAFQGLSMVELLSQSKKHADVRTFLVGLQSGAWTPDGKKGYQGDAGQACRRTLTVMSRYVSRIDARALMYALVKTYGKGMNKQACVDEIKSDVEAVGLKF